MFPVQLLMVRRSRKGLVRSVFLSEEHSDYCSSIIDLFRNAVGMKREDIEKEISLLELKSQNPKIVKGLALLMFRLSVLEPPSKLDPQEVRQKVFSISRNPAVSPEERDALLNKIAFDMGTSIDDLKNALYADKESEQVLVSVPDISPEQLARKFNTEQIETVMLKSTVLRIDPGKNKSRFIRFIRRFGLLYSEAGEQLIVSGPLSIMEHSERYGSSMALLVRKMLYYDGWSLEATVTLKNGKEKKDYIYRLDSGATDYAEHEETADVDGFSIPKVPLKINGLELFPDYAFTEKNVYVIITRSRYFQEDFSIAKRFIESGLNIEIICILNNKEKCPNGALCFKDEIDWKNVRSHILGRYMENNEKAHDEANESIEDLAGVLDSLYPDSDAMISFLESKHLDPLKVLEKLGYKIRWVGLSIIITK